jgi:hypothetical protein
MAGALTYRPDRSEAALAFQLREGSYDLCFAFLDHTGLSR